MREFSFRSELWLLRPRNKVFAFFGDARNLQAITPTWVNFEILTPMPIEIRAGAVIDYRLRIRGFPIRWRTEITVWEPSSRFVDEQKRGPYRQWIHEHTFVDQNGGTLCRDHVRYAVWGGALINWLFVRRDVERIFAFRGERLRQLLN